MFARVDSPPERVYTVLAAVERYPGWMPRVKEIDATPIDTAGARHVAFRVEGPFGEVAYLVERRHAPPVVGRPGRIWWSLVQGEFRDLTGSWEVTAAPGGGSIVTYRSLARPLRWVPQSLVRTFARREVRGVAESLRRRVAARA